MRGLRREGSEGKRGNRETGAGLRRVTEREKRADGHGALARSYEAAGHEINCLVRWMSWIDPAEVGVEHTEMWSASSA